MAAIITQTGNGTLDPKKYSEKDLNLIGEFPVESEFTPTTDVIEYYVYDINNNLISYLPEFTKFNVIRDDPSTGETTNQISLNVENNLRNRGYFEGTYQTVYNFFRNKLNSSESERFFIKEISPSRTEIRLSSNTLDNSTLDILTSDFITEKNNSEYFEDFFINFGFNDQFVASNIILDDEDPNKFTILIKLYDPLPNNFEINDTCWVCVEVADPKVFLVEFERIENEVDRRLFLQGPNFNIEIKDEISSATNFKTLNDLLDNTELTSSYNQLQNLLDQKGISLNIDYGLDVVDFKNFTYFSSAEQRIKNFYYKIALIENANNNITSIDSLSGTPDVSSSLATYEQTITDTIKSFDGFEFFMYYNSSSQGTEGTTWPKLNLTSPYTLQSTGSSNVDTWYTRMLNSASAYDQENSNNLIYTIPEYLRDDPQNASYELFIEMMGQYFDQLYFYVEDITNKYDADNRLDFGVSKDIIADVLKSFGIKLYENNFSSNDLYSSLLGINASGSLLPPTGSEVITTYITASDEAIPLNDVNKETYKRIYHNMPYLLKKKGTVEGVRALINLFGIPDTILRISEFGGKDKDNTNDWDYTQNVFNYGTFISSSAEETGIISASWVINEDWDAQSDCPETFLFRFKPSNILPTEDEYSLITHLPFGNFTGLTLAYTGSGYDSASYSGSIPSSSNQVATLALWDGIDILSPITNVSASFYDGNWWSVQVSRNAGTAPQDFTLRVANQIYNGKDGFKIGYATSSIVNSSAIGWLNASNLYLPVEGGHSQVLNGKTYKGLTGSYQELRYYNEVLSEATFHDFVMNPHSIEGLNYSSSANNLVFRAPLGSDLKQNTGNLTSIHPKVTGSLANITSSFSGDSEYYIGSNVIFTSNTEFIYQDQPAVGIKNRVSEKIRSITADTASGNTLTPYRSIRQYYPQSESYTRDINYVEVAFSPQNEINDDINSSFGYFNIGEYIGDPSYVSESRTSYRSLDKLRDNYFEKYNKNYNWTDYIRLIKYFDNSLFKMIKDFVPAKSSLSTGVVIKQHLLERNRQRPTQVESTHQDNYSGSIKSQQYWNNIETTSIMSSSVIESISADSATGRIPNLEFVQFSGSISATGSMADQAQLNEVFPALAPIYSGSTISSSGIFNLDEAGWISMSFVDENITQENLNIIVPQIEFELVHKMGLKVDGDTLITQAVSSSIRGLLTNTLLTYTGYNNGGYPSSPGWSEFTSVFTNLSPSRGECFQIVTAFTATGTDQVRNAGYFAPEGERSLVGVGKKNSFSNTAGMILHPGSDVFYLRKDLASNGDFVLLNDNLSALIAQKTQYTQVINIPNPDSYDIKVDSIAGKTTLRIEDTRQLYNGEWEGTEFKVNDQILSTASFEGSNIEFAFSTDYTESISFWEDFDFAPGYVFIDTNVSNLISISPSGSESSRGQVGIGGTFDFGGTSLPKDMITFYVPTLPDKGKEEDVFNFDDFNPVERVTHFVLSISSSFSVDGGEFQYTSSIENLVNSFNPGDVFSLQVEEDFTGYTGTPEQYKVANIILGNQTAIRGNKDVLFSIANPEEVYSSLAGNWGAMISHSIHKFSSTDFGNPGNFPSSELDDFYHTGQNAANFKIKLIRQKPLSKLTVMPIEGNLNNNRKNKNYFEVDYETGLITPTNQLAIQNKTAQLASIPESNYTVKGISNSRYNGSKVTSRKINEIN